MAEEPGETFAEASAIEVTSPRSARAVVPVGWEQGRGAFGGLVVALLVRAAESVADGRPLRSLTVEICGPVQPGTVELAIEPLRAGSAVTTTAVRLVQGGGVLAHAVAVLGQDRPIARDLVALAPPTMRPWREVVSLPVRPPLASPFGQHFDFRSTGPLPFAAGTVAASEGWIRPLRPGAGRDVALLAACVDAYWPAVLALEPGPRPTATIAFTLQPFPRFDGLDPESPFYVRSRALVVDAGYSVEQRELWGEDGRLLALNQQTFVVIK